jgi:O-antigen ligase
VDRRIDTEAVGVALAVAVLVLLPVTRRLVLWTPYIPVDDFLQMVAVAPLDVPLALLIVLQLATAVSAGALDLGNVRRWPRPLQWSAMLVLWMGTATLANPSWRAAYLAFHVAGVWAIVRCARETSVRGRNILLGSFAAMAVSQAVLGIAQSRVGRPMGADLLGYDDPLIRFGEAAAGQGSFAHPYHLATLLAAGLATTGILVTQMKESYRGLAAAAVAIMGTAIVLTFSRTALLSVVALFVFWAQDRRARVLTLALVAGVAVGVLLGASGVDAKASKFQTRTNFDSGRVHLAEEALDLVAGEPLFGVGPGRYVLQLQEDSPGTDIVWPPHNVVLHTAGESGVLGGVLAAVTIGSFCWWTSRRSLAAFGVAMVVLPFHLLDSYPHVLATGFVISGMWIATVSTAADAGPSPETSRMAPRSVHLPGSGSTAGT